MNYNEILDLLKEKMTVSEFAFGDFGRSSGRGRTFVEGIGECDEVKHYGGEGKGEEWYSVKFFPDHDIYIKVEGYYSSYNGTEFDGGWRCCTEVRPQEKTIIIYKSI